MFNDKRHPKEMGAAEINHFLTYLAVNRSVSAETQNQALCALVFMYKQMLEQQFYGLIFSCATIHPSLVSSSLLLLKFGI